VPSGRYLRHIGGIANGDDGSADAASLFEYPSSVAVHGGRVFVGDASRANVVVCDEVCMRCLALTFNSSCELFSLPPNYECTFSHLVLIFAL
jgi:hypothetical protein